MKKAMLLRPARSSDSPDVAARLLYATSEELLRCLFSLGKSTERTLSFLARAWQLPNGPFSHSHAMIAENAEGAFVGLALAFAPSIMTMREHTALLPLLRQEFRGAEFLQFLFRALPSMGFQEGIPDDAFYLAHLSVLPDVRSHGIGAVLLQHTIERAQAGGYASCMLHVTVGNDRARALYERNGFRSIGVFGVPWMERRYGVHPQEGMLLRFSRAVASAETAT